VVDKVKVWYVKTDDYWLAKVQVVEDDDVTVQLLVEVGPNAPDKVPLGHVHTLGPDGGYGDGSSTLGGASSSKEVGSKRKRTEPQDTEDLDWALEDVTKIVVVPASGAYEGSSVSERTTVTFICFSVYNRV
jgi:hypothetical protein